jgi:hypothetical protein
MGRVSSYEQRLKELQKETQRLRKDIRSVSKQLQRSGVDPDEIRPRAAARTSHAAEPAPAAPAPAAVKPASAQAPGPAPAPAVEQHYPGLRTPARMAEPEESPAPAARKPAVDPERFTTYLSSGSFGKAVPLTRERRVMRNRALFMLAVVALLTALLYHFIF